MYKFFDENGVRHLVQAEIKTSNGVNGERSVSGEIWSNDTVIHSIGRGWKLEVDDEVYCVTYALPVDDSKEVVVEFDAVHQFFFDFEKSVVHKELNGSHTFDTYLSFIFEGSGYRYVVETDVLAFEKESFGFKNRLTLFKDIVKSVGVEFSVSGKVVRILKEVGTDLSTIVEKGFNLQELRLEHNIGEFITYKKGYGAFIDPDDEKKGRLEVEYKSPLADVYGILEGDPIIDERYTISDNLLTRLKNDVDNSYSVAVSLNMEDLTQSGYRQDMPVAGDYIMAINDDIGFRKRVRIISFESSYDLDGELINHQISCNSLSMSKLNSQADDNWKSEIEANLENTQKDVNHALVSANGKNVIFYGLFGENGEGEPEATRKGDLWYKPVGEEIIAYIWDGNGWKEHLSTKENTIIKDKIEELETESKQQQADIDESLKKAEEAIVEAFNSSTIAKQAEKDAFNAAQNANAAKTNADKAVVDAKKALDDLGNLQVGGRNYLLNSSDPSKTTSLGSNEGSPNKMPMSFKLLTEGKNTQFYRAMRISTDNGDNRFNMFSLIDLAKLSVPKDTLGKTIVSFKARAQHNIEFKIMAAKVTPNIYTKDNGKAIQLTTEWNTFFVEFDTFKDCLGVRAAPGYPTRYTDIKDLSTFYVDICAWKIEEGTKPTDWTPASEDVQIQVSQINNELSTKISQTEFNKLEGTVLTQQTQITQNKTDITSKADKSEVDTLKGTVEIQGTQITQNAEAIEQRATKSEVNTLTGRVDVTETALTTQAGQLTALSTKTDGNSTQIGKLESSYEGLNSTVSKVETDLKNLGNINLLLNGSNENSKERIADGTTTGSFQDYRYVTLKLPNDLITGDSYTLSFLPEKLAGDFINYTIREYTTGKTVSAVYEDGKRYVFTFNKNANSDSILVYAGIMGQTIGNKISIKNIMLNKGTKALEYFPTTSELTTKSEFSTFQQTVQGFQTTVNSEISGLVSEQTQMAGQIASIVKTVDGQKSEITQLSDNINLKVDKDNVITSINLSPESAIIKSKFIHLAGDSLIDNAIITSAMIKNVSADSMNFGTLNGADVNIINMNASNIVTGDLRGISLTSISGTGKFNVTGSEAVFTNTTTGNMTRISENGLKIYNKNNILMSRLDDFIVNTRVLGTSTANVYLGTGGNISGDTGVTGGEVRAVEYISEPGDGQVTSYKYTQIRARGFVGSYLNANTPIGETHVYLRPKLKTGEVRVTASMSTDQYQDIRVREIYGNVLQYNGLSAGDGKHIYLRPRSDGEVWCTKANTTNDTVPINARQANVTAVVTLIANTNLYLGMDGELRVTGTNLGVGSITYKPVRASAFNNGSLAEYKQNIHEFKESALDLINQSKVYSYQLKARPEVDEVGLVIGDNYKITQAVVDGDGVNQYRMTSLAWKAIQELNNEIRELKELLKIA